MTFLETMLTISDTTSQFWKDSILTIDIPIAAR